MALDPVDGAERIPVPRQGRIRRCWVRHVAILPDGQGRRTQVDCLLGGRESPLSLGTIDDARAICNACTATTVWRADED